MMRGVIRQSRDLYAALIVVLLLLLGVQQCCCSLLSYSEKSSKLAERRADVLLPDTSPTSAPQPFLPLLAPSPLTPFANSTIPKLSGLCVLNFTVLSDMMIVTSTDCMAAFAPVLANVVCCPQVEATLAVLIGQSSKYTSTLALNGSLAAHCLSDFEQILVGQGANDSLSHICSIRPANLTEGSCPVSDLVEFESTVDSSNLLAACEKIDSVNECCEQVCQNAILDAARKLAQKAYNLLTLDGSLVLSDHSNRINDCKSVVLRWLGSRLEPSTAKEVLRGVSSCRINKVCPLNFPNVSRVIHDCGSGNNSNETACCSSIESYVSHLQRQSFVTNLQALNCAASLGVKLRKANITKNVYSQCRISLKDFSLQVGAQESGCLLPSLPSDVVFDKSSGVSFLCDLNDNIPAPWPASSQLPSSSCNKTVKIPALPAAASGQSRFDNAGTMCRLCLMIYAAAILIFTA
ncbi:uncharacterized GPI-anchored protein At1g61900 [Andrographis paniculata]|uniref:uncharacterized GPI-anchored protein At1g61900 n=1 Tax=Andrographis paniculata TaxID=175694 RepID=UPI0021E79B79|nr:uncharacterized GPI-anchored protein At1g61900 [Andrographis paniculata]XP_051128760.1 uncharacterized GPI-anchored protein At1g61900 [Andrographis paniculata]